jgi:uncharacterized SAM-binding protein YcdF (DUF218 family)
MSKEMPKSPARPMYRPFRWARRWLVGAAAAFGFVIGAITFLPVLEPWISALRGNWTDSPGDTLIVLGNDITAGNVLGLGSYWRAVYAVFEWRGGHYREIVISGAQVALPMRDFIVSQGVPADAVRLETKSGSTRENALFVAAMLQQSPGRKVLLTSDYHMFRALRAFRKAGLDVTPRPFPDAGKLAGARPLRCFVFLTLVQESVKIVWYRLHGWI